MHKYALSEQGAADMLKAFAAVTVSDLVLMMPVSLLYFLVKDYMEGNLGARAGFYIGGVAAALSASLLFGMDGPIEVHNPGGTNRVAFERLDGRRFRAALGGNTAVVAKGELGPDA
mgnify:CR=1 FL=1